MVSPVCQAHHILPPGVTAIVGRPCHTLSSSAYVSAVPSATGRSVTPGSVDQNPTAGASSAASAAVRADAANGAHSDTVITAANTIPVLFISVLRQNVMMSEWIICEYR